MASSCAIQVKLELGHRAQVRKKPTVEGFTHDWMVFVRGPEHSNIQHFVEKVVFHLHESFPRPKRVCKDPPYKVEESGYAGFILPIEVYFKNKEEPKKVRFDYDLFLHLEGHPPVNHLRCEKLTFNNPAEEFRRKLLKAGGIMVMSDGTSFPSGQSLHLPNLPRNSLPFSEVKKKSSHGLKDRTKNMNANSSSSSSNSFSKPHKLTKEHKEKFLKDSKEHKSAFKEPSREHSKSSKESSKKPKGNKLLKDEKIVPKMALKELKSMSKEPKSENITILTITGRQQQEKKVPTKRSSVIDSDELSAKKRKKSSSESLFKRFSSASPLILTCSADKKQTQDKSQLNMGKVKMDSDTVEKKKPSLPPFGDTVGPNDSDKEEENLSSKSESEHPSPASSSSSSSLTPSQNSRQQGPLQSIMKDLHSDDNQDESDEADKNDNDSELERPVNTHEGSKSHRVSVSDGSDSDSSSASSLLHCEPPPPLLKTSNNQILEVKSPIKQNKSDKQIKNGDCDKAYLDELVELHRRLMTLRERHVLQQT
ncbi:protein AF-9 isoform X2 [Struthio camelus]|uniref:protein AF-9 isoform X2 n=1 Tax=Struthio camelus TaxID=8801 RepID=UPI0023FF9090